MSGSRSWPALGQWIFWILVYIRITRAAMRQPQSITIGKPITSTLFIRSIFRTLSHSVSICPSTGTRDPVGGCSFPESVIYLGCPEATHVVFFYLCRRPWPSDGKSSSASTTLLKTLSLCVSNQVCALLANMLR